MSSPEMAEGRLSVVGSRAHDASTPTQRDPLRHHAFSPMPDPTKRWCVKCGRPGAAHNHPELQNAALISHGDMLRKAIGERSYSDVRFQLGVISKLLEEMDA